MPRPLYYLCVTVVLLMNTGTHAAELSADDLIARNAVRLFFEGCLKIYPDPDRFARWIEQNELPLFPADQMASFLDGKPGKVWAVDNKDVQYALAAQDDNRCSVFVRQVSSDSAQRQLQPLLDALLKPDVRESMNSKLETLDGGSRTTLTYIYKRADGRWLITITATMNEHADAAFQLALSGSTFMRKSPAP